MNYEERDTYGMYKGRTNGGNVGALHEGSRTGLMGADTLIGTDVHNEQADNLGEIKEIMLDMRSGRVEYAVLSFGGFLGMGEKLFAVPWGALKLDADHKYFVLNVDKERLKSAPGFDKDNWPNMVDPTWATSIHSYYGTKSYTARAM
uniref:PRC-barrel n=1 Tax=mine drainage metagenome TaxID=410659 RepID=E6PJU7_9ZZZZ